MQDHFFSYLFVLCLTCASQEVQKPWDGDHQSQSKSYATEVQVSLFNDSPMMSTWWFLADLSQGANANREVRPEDRFLGLQVGDDWGHTHGLNLSVAWNQNPSRRHRLSLQTDLWTELATQSANSEADVLPVHFVEENRLQYLITHDPLRETWVWELGLSALQVQDQKLTWGATGQQQFIHENSSNLQKFKYLPGPKGEEYSGILHLKTGIQEGTWLSQKLRTWSPEFLAPSLVLGTQIGLDLHSNSMLSAWYWSQSLHLQLGAELGNHPRPIQRWSLALERVHRGSENGESLTWSTQFAWNSERWQIFVQPHYFSKRNANNYYFAVQDMDRTGFSYGLKLRLP
jgi:hypothetical protein